MNRLKGPELRMPDLKVPLVLVDLFYDLRDRRLLPFVALVVVAIVAAPFLLSNTGSSAPASPSAGASEAVAGGSRFAVVKADPGLRVPSKRLKHLPVKDPFQQKFTGPVLNPGSEPITQTSTPTSSTSTTSPTSVTTSTESGVTATSPASPGSSAPAEPPSGGDTGTANPPIEVFTFAIEVKISKTTGDSGEKEKSEPETRQRVLPATTLPGKKTQVVTYIGIAPKTKKPLFLVSTEVKSVFGEGQCVAGTANCQLLELEPGFPETFVYGENDVRYKISVLKVVPVATGHS